MTDTPAALEHSIEEALEAERLRLEADIRSYPPPIPACDVYFNDLLERRGRLCAALDALRSRRAVR